jgi:hypothetical protein
MDAVLADMLFGAWYDGDATIRQALADAIRTYVQRHPTFRKALAQPRYGRQRPLAGMPNQNEVLAAYLFALWQLGDAELRSAVEAIIRNWVARCPSALAELKRLPPTSAPPLPTPPNLKPFIGLSGMW